MKKIVALFGKDKEEVLSEARKVNGYNIDFLEIRADFLDDLSVENIEGIIKALREIYDREIILTLRTKREGGNYAGLDYAVRVHSFLDLSMDFIDLQINELTDQAMKDMMTHAKAKNTKTVLSVHHMNRGVSKGIFQYYIDKAIKYDADIVKIVDMPKTRAEVIHKLILSGEYSGKHSKPELISISMGDLGVISRYETNIYKPEYTFINITDELNIGQIRIEDMDAALSQKKIINFYTYLDTILGKLYLYSDLNGISELTYELPRKIDGVIDIHYEDAILREGINQLKEYFTKERKSFELKYSIDANGFEKNAYDQLLNTQYGQTLTYKELATLAGNEGASRAVGNAMAKNKLPIFIPCHRVVKSTGDIGEYTGGTYRKQILLALEKEN